MSLIVFHFAGGNKYSTQRIFGDFKNGIFFEMDRNGQGNLNYKINNFIDKLKNLNVKTDEYIFYGHSMGALLAYLICQKLQEQNLPMPKKLVVSGKKAPSIPREKKISDLSDEEFWEEIVSLGGIPEEILNYPELIDYYLPILRHDFKLVESYQYEKKPKLNIPIDVFYGSEEATKEEMLGWKEETNEEVIITQMEGNHFFIFKHVDFFTDYFKNIEKTLISNYA